MRILLVDDDKDLCQLTQKVLTKHGYLVDAFNDAQLSLQHARINKPNLILMDIMLPGISGPEVISALKQEAQFKDVPVIFMTGLVTGGDRWMEDGGIMVAGVKYQTLGKPYEIERLLSVVKQHIKV